MENNIFTYYKTGNKAIDDNFESLIDVFQSLNRRIYSLEQELEFKGERLEKLERSPLDPFIMKIMCRLSNRIKKLEEEKFTKFSN